MWLEKRWTHGGGRLTLRLYDELNCRSVNVLLNNITLLGFLLFSMCQSFYVAVKPQRQRRQPIAIPQLSPLVSSMHCDDLILK